MSNTRAHQESMMSKSRTFTASGVGAALLTVLCFLTGQPAAFAADAPIGLGAAGGYSVLGGQAVTNTGPSRLDADLGVSPGTAITGFPPGFAGGLINAGNAAAERAQADLVSAYHDAESRTPTDRVSGDLMDLTLGAGVYNSTSSLIVGGTLTLDGEGDPNAVFIFQAASTLTTGSVSKVDLIGGARACNVFWQVGSSASLGMDSSFAGTILAQASITATTNAAVEGRVLARNGAVTLDNNTFTTPDCLPDPTEPVPVPDPTEPAPAPVPVPDPTEPAPVPVPTDPVPVPVPDPTEPAPVPVPLPTDPVPAPAPVPVPDPTEPAPAPVPVPDPTEPAPVPVPLPTDPVPVPVPDPTAPAPAPVPVPDPTEPVPVPLPTEPVPDPADTVPAPVQEIPVPGATADETAGTSGGSNRGTNIDSASSGGSLSALTVMAGIGAAGLAVLAGVSAVGRRTTRRH